MGGGEKEREGGKGGDRGRGGIRGRRGEGEGEGGWGRGGSLRASRRRPLLSPDELVAMGTEESLAWRGGESPWRRPAGGEGGEGDVCLSHNKRTDLCVCVCV